MEERLINPLLRENLAGHTAAMLYGRGMSRPKAEVTNPLWDSAQRGEPRRGGSPPKAQVTKYTQLSFGVICCPPFGVRMYLNNRFITQGYASLHPGLRRCHPFGVHVYVNKFKCAISNSSPV